MSKEAVNVSKMNEEKNGGWNKWYHLLFIYSEDLFFFCFSHNLYITDNSW